MTTKAADDVDAIRAGLLRIEEEKRRMLNGGVETPIDAQLELPGVASEAPAWLPAGTVRAIPGMYGIYERWNGKAWVSQEEWEDRGVQT